MIPHSKPLMHPDDFAAVSAVLESGMLACGPVTTRFEEAFAAFIGRPHAAAVSSGTAALSLVLRALGTGAGDEVVIPAYACSALLYAVRFTGAVPVLADAGEDGFHPDADTIRRVLTPCTRAVVFAHLFGGARSLSDIIALGVPVIEDCAMAPGAGVNGRRAGNLGTAASVFSFYATKVLAAGEGGMALADDARITGTVRDLADYADKIDGILRFNFTMTGLSAALGLSQLGRLDAMIARRRELAARYTETLAGTGLDLPRDRPGERGIFYRYVVGTDRVDAMRRILHERGVRAERPVFAPLSRYPGVSPACPAAERAWERALSLPLYPALTGAEAETVAREARNAARP